MPNFAKIAAEAGRAKEAADRAWQDMAFKAMGIADQVHWIRNTGGPTEENMETLYRFLDHYEAAQRESDAKRAASLEAGRKWVAEAEAALAQVGRKQ